MIHEQTVVNEARIQAVGVCRSRFQGLDKSASADSEPRRGRGSGGFLLGAWHLVWAEKIKKSPAPFVHAATKATRQFFYGLYAEFVAAYRTAAEKLRAGDPKPGFPVGSFPPPMPFVTG